MPLEPPTESSFVSLEKALEELTAHAKSEKYVIKIGRSRTVGNKKGNIVKHVVIQCVHGGVHKAKEHKHRNTSTSRTDWSFQATLRRNEADGSFTLTVEDGGHNHDAAEDMAADTAARTLDAEQKVTVLHLAKSGVSPKATLSTLRQSEPMRKTILRDIYNLKVKAKYASLAGRPPLEAFLEKLVEKHISHKIRRDTSWQARSSFRCTKLCACSCKRVFSK